MIVWGGMNNTNNSLGTGGRYDPATDAWQAMSTEGAPERRYQHHFLWLGDKAMVWAGFTGLEGWHRDGAFYHPDTDTWTPVGVDDQAPTLRSDERAVWTGEKVVVYGGWDEVANNIYRDDGASYDPETDSWTAIDGTVPGAPRMRGEHTMVWTGEEVLIWGGRSMTGYHNDGAAMKMANGSWRSIPSADDSPAPRKNAEEHWMGSLANQLIVWGGDDTRRSGGIYCAASCDDEVPGPATIDSMTKGVPSELVQLMWSQAGSGITHDVLAGDVGELLRSGGNFATATTDCVGSAVATFHAEDLSPNVPGQARWYLIRSRSGCAGAGTWDSGDAQLVRSRDDSIEHSSARCP